METESQETKEFMTCYYAGVRMLNDGKIYPIFYEVDGDRPSNSPTSFGKMKSFPYPIGTKVKFEKRNGGYLTSKPIIDGFRNDKEQVEDWELQSMAIRSEEKIKKLAMSKGNFIDRAIDDLADAINRQPSHTRHAIRVRLIAKLMGVLK